MDKFLLQPSAGKVKVCRIVVQDARDVSEAVTEITGIRHESPQVLLIRNGDCIWSTSHRKITEDALVRAIGK